MSQLLLSRSDRVRELNRHPPSAGCGDRLHAAALASKCSRHPHAKPMALAPPRLAAAACLLLLVGCAAEQAAVAAAALDAPPLPPPISDAIRTACGDFDSPSVQTPTCARCPPAAPNPPIFERI